LSDRQVAPSHKVCDEREGIGERDIEQPVPVSTSTGRSVTLASDCAAHISSATEITETSEESLTSVISVLAIGGIMRIRA
jgi:hypothetical protein